jgi:hypothetical protein
LRIKGRITGIFRRQPHMMPPWFKLVMCQNTTDCGRGNRLCDPGLDKGTREFGAIPLGETPATQFGPLTGQLDQMDSYFGGESPGDVPGALYLQGRGDPAGGSV